MHTTEKQVLRLGIAGHALVHLFEGVTPPLIPLLAREFNTSYLALGAVVTLFGYLFGFGSIPAGYLTDRVGPRRLISIYLVGAGVVSLLFPLARSLLMYAFFTALIGLFASSYHAAGNTLISRTVSEKGKAFGIHGIAGSIGTALVPALAAGLAALGGWRAPHLVFGVLSIGLGVLSLRVPEAPAAIAPQTPAPTSTTSATSTSSAASAASATAATSATPAAGPKARRPLGPVPARYLVAFWLGTGLFGLAMRGVLTFLPAYLGESFALFGEGNGIDIVTLGGVSATVVLLSGAVGQYLGGIAADKYSGETLYVLILLMSSLLLPFMALSSGFALVAIGIVFALFGFAVQPVQNFLLVRYVHPESHGKMFGIHFFLVFGVGSAGAVVSGYLADVFGLASVFLGMGLFSTVATLCILYLHLSVRAGLPASPVTPTEVS
ncbi:MAG: MFS transporter [Spirochaetaceae bacterium]|nr:MAG: MFS transporter [Spirochaetaceae bacterium]